MRRIKMKVNPKKCPQNHKCPAVYICKYKAICQTGYGLPNIDKSKCTNCGKCVNFCPMGAIEA